MMERFEDHRLTELHISAIMKYYRGNSGISEINETLLASIAASNLIIVELLQRLNEKTDGSK